MADETTKPQPKPWGKAKHVAYDAPSPDVAPIATPKQARKSVEVQFADVSGWLLTRVVAKEINMAQARVALREWYQTLSLEERGQIANQRRLAEMVKQVGEAIHQEFVVVSQPDVFGEQK